MRLSLQNKFSLLTFLFFCTFFNIFGQGAIPTSSYGVWSRGGDPLYDSAEPNYSYIRGITNATTPDWSDIQPNNNDIFNFDRLQANIDKAYNEGQLVALKINVGPQSPSWIYTNGVPAVFTTGHRLSKFPHYLDDTYIGYYHDLIDAFGEFVYSQTPEKLAIISFIFPQHGATGDEEPYKGNLIQESIDADYAINDDQWQTFRLNSWDYWRSVFRDGPNRQIPFLINNVDSESREWNWMVENLGEDFGFKASNPSARGHHLTNEKSWVEEYRKFLVAPEGLQLFNRAEMDQTWTRPLYQINTELGFYWGVISGLNSGLSIWDVTGNALEAARVNTSIQESFRFFTEYASQVYPAASTKAFIVLHEGLDSRDTEKFPETIYGDANRNFLDRYAAICNDPIYASRGARMDDLESANDGQVSQRSDQVGYNDAGWDIWPTNYSRFIDQVNPEAESIGLFRVGGNIDENSPIYSRFARSFEHISGKNAMYFKMNENFFDGNAGVVKISVIYYDNSADSTWELQYDAGDGVDDFKTAFVIDDNTGSNTWKTRTIVVDDAVMSGNGPQNADFALVNTDDKDDIFHRIEIEHFDGSDTVSIESPVYGQNIILDENPDAIVTAIGYDSEGISEMRFNVDNGSFSSDTTEPYAFTFSNLGIGEHTLLVQMLDNNGNILNSEEVLINVLATAPIEDFVTITSPIDGDIFSSGSDITVIADGFDNQGIELMRFKANDDGFINDDTSVYSNVYTGLPVGDHTFIVQMRDSNGIRITSEEVTITISATLSTDTLSAQEENQLYVYPTVVEDVLNWKSNIVVEQIRIFDIAGREILNKKVINSSSINLSDLKSGIYLFNFQTNKGVIISEKIIKL